MEISITRVKQLKLSYVAQLQYLGQVMKMIITRVKQLKLSYVAQLQGHCTLQI